MELFADKLCFSPKLFESAWLGWTATVFLVAAFVVSLAIFFTALKGKKKEDVKEKAENEDEEIGCGSIVGTRKYQQDRVAVAKAETEIKQQMFFAVVCDGMGGMDDGERASEFSLRRLVNFFTSIKSPTEFGKGIKPTIKECDREVAGFTDGAGRPIDSGTTLVAAMICENRLTWVSVGDSAVYLFENNRLKKLNKEHNYGLAVEEMLESGEITQEQADKEPNKEMLISYIGIGDVSRIDGQNMTEVASDAILMLCSDGVTKIVTDDELQVLLQTNKDALPQKIAEEIIDYSVKNRIGSQDNTTVAIIKCKNREKKNERK